MKPLPFKLPVRIEDERFLVAADHELIMEAHGAAPDELEAIVTAVNGFHEAVELLDWVSRCARANVAGMPARFVSEEKMGLIRELLEKLK